MLLSFVAVPLLEPFYRANLRLLLWLNGYVAEHPALYRLALFLTDRGSDILMLLTLVLLWFWARNQNPHTVFGDAPLVLQRQQRPWQLRRLSGAIYESDNAPILTREQSRAQVLIMAVSVIFAFLLTRVIAFELNLARPLNSYWPVEALVPLRGISQSLWQPGSLPSDYAALLAGFCAGLFFWNRRLAWVWMAIAVILGLCRVAIGLHYPFDLIIGAIIGVACVWFPLQAYQARGALYHRANDAARAFEMDNTPYCYLLYFVAFLVGLEALSHFEHIVKFLMTLRGAIFGALGRG
jgi:membrane-associated phospholipid phosphatase